MNFFSYQSKQLYAEQIPLSKLVEQFSTPCYVYSRAALEQHWQAFDKPLAHFPHLICYAVKANSNLAVLNILARLGSGFDVVSQGELMRVIAAGGDPAKVVFSGVGKTLANIEHALQAGIQSFNVESVEELHRINSVAQKLNLRAPIALRINPDVTVDTHRYISTGLKENKFGIPNQQAIEAYQIAASLSNLNVIGIHCHIGSQILELDPFLNAADKILTLIDELNSLGIHLQQIDLGGGIGVQYHVETPISIDHYAQALVKKIGTRKLRLLLEPGRAIAANAGVLLTRVEYLKQTPDKHFAIVDAGMNDLLRPALYEAWQAIIPVQQRDDINTSVYDVVGPVCETADFLGKNRELKITEGDTLAVCGAGAYGFSMSSNYNSRARPAEVMVDGNKVHLIRPREMLEDLFRCENSLS